MPVASLFRLAQNSALGRRFAPGSEDTGGDDTTEAPEGIGTSLPRVHHVVPALLFSIACVALASGVRWLLADVLEEGTPYLLYIASVAVVTYLCGWRYGVFTTLLSLSVGSYLFAVPIGSIAVHHAEDVLSAAMFLFASTVILGAFAAEDAARRGILARDARLRRELGERSRLERELEAARRLESVGQLAGGIAHDFNNLLSVVLGNAELLANKLPADEDVESIVLAAKRGSELTRQLLGFAGRQVMALHELSLNQAVQDTYRLGKRVIPENIRFELELARDLWPIEADPIQVQQVVLNLITNARDAMPDGGTLTITTENAGLAVGDVPGGDYVRLRVADTGSGMSEALQARVFEPFFTTKQAGRGTGLGLSVAYGIVKQLRGRISVVSSLGQGSTFEVLWPRSETPGERSPERPRTQPKPGKRLNVLVVEDDPLVRSVICRLLHSLGHSVQSAEDSALAIGLARQASKPFDVLVTDLVMPGINGRELAERLLAEYPGLTVLLVSGYSGAIVEEQGLSPSGMMLIKKPFSAAELEAALAAVTSSRGTEVDSRKRTGEDPA